MDKKILFVCYGLGVGGIEKCLVNLINVMPRSLQIDVLLMNPQYAFKENIKRPVRFLNIFDYVMNIEDTPNEIRRCHNLARKLKLLLAYLLFRLRIKLRKDAWAGFESLPDEYDIAVAYSHHDFSPYYVIDKVCAKKKVMWYHNGAYEETGARYERDKKYFCQFDHVVAVSADCEKVLSSTFDFREGQLLVLKNICDADGVRDKSVQSTPLSFEKKGLHIVTVGRVTAEKGADMAVDVCRALRDAGRNIYWHWIGEGNQSKAIQQKISKYGLQDRFLMEGNQNNPYPYIRCADIYVQPSYYEAYSTTITEAKVLCKPIVTTDVGGMRDQLTHGISGILVPVDVESIAAALEMLIDNKELRMDFIEALRAEDFGPEKALADYMRTVFSWR